MAKIEGPLRNPNLSDEEDRLLDQIMDGTAPEAAVRRLGLDKPIEDKSTEVTAEEVEIDTRTPEQIAEDQRFIATDAKRQAEETARRREEEKAAEAAKRSRGLSDALHESLGIK